MVLNIIFSIVVVDDLRIMAKPLWLQFGMLFMIEVKYPNTSLEEES
jgi:hypothetical protein